jgi:transcriptional regulator with XRE-family HTH domain
VNVLRRQLGRRLRQLRKAAGKTETDVDEAGLASRVKLWRIETGKVTVKVGDVRGLCWLYDADQATTEMLSRWAFAVRQTGWWEDFDRPLPIHDRLYLDLEATAQHLYVYDVRLIPDLLHTPDYARAQYLAVYPEATESDVVSYLKHHQERQTALVQRTPPLRLTAVLDDSVLSRPVGGPGCMHAQIQQLRELTDHIHIDLRYIPGPVGAHPAMRVGGFTLLEFTGPDDPDVVYLESHTGARYLELASEVTEYRRIFATVYSNSVPINDHAEPCTPVTGLGPTRPPATVVVTACHPGGPAGRHDRRV